jgi:acyl carrier protein
MSASGEIRAKVTKVLVGSLGVDEDDVTPPSSLQDDLGAESIDFLDITFRLEREFGFSIPRGELFPDTIFGDDPQFVRDGSVTDEGVDLLRSRMPYADLTSLEYDRSLATVAELFTVDLLVRYVGWKLAGGEQAAAAARERALVARN